MYGLWYAQKEDVLRTYTNKMPERIPLEQEKEFRTIRNAVVQAALKINLPPLPEQAAAAEQHIDTPEAFDISAVRFAEEMPESVPEEQPLSRHSRPRVPLSNWWSDEYRLARLKQAGSKDSPPIQEEAEKWYRLAYQGFLRIEQEMPDDKLYYRLGSMNLHSIGTEKNLDRAREYLHKAAIMGNVDAVYGMGKLYLESDVRKAISMFELAAEQGNIYTEYQLGKLYCFGQGVPQNLEVGMEWMKASASHGNEYASVLLEKVQNHIHHQTTSAVFGLFRGLASMIQNSANNFIRRRNSIDRKQQQKIEEKKQAHGQRSSGYEYDYSEGQSM